MGILLSCCKGRRQKNDDIERQRLLQTSIFDLSQHEARSDFEHIADVLAALHSGKLPSQDQIGVALRRLMNSNILRVDSRSIVDGALDRESKQVIDDVKDVIQAVMQAGVEKNDDDLIQGLIYNYRHLSSSPVHVKESSHVKRPKPESALSDVAIPTKDELANDTAIFLKSLRTLSSLILTSSAFRLILSDILLTAREMVTDTAEKVRRAAEMVEDATITVEDAVRPGEHETYRHDYNKEKPENANNNPRDMKEAILDRVEDIIVQAQASPSYNAALRTILYLFRKYASRVYIASLAARQAVPSGTVLSPEDLATVIAPDPRFSRVVEDVKILIQRFAGGRSVDAIFQLFSKIVVDLTVTPANPNEAGIPEARDYFHRVDLWLDTALVDPQFARSHTGRRSASDLFDEGRKVLTQNEQIHTDFRELTREIQDMTDAICNDRSTIRLLGTISSLQISLKSFMQALARRGQHAAQNWQLTALRLLVGYLLPRFLSAVKVVPMPRIEYMQKDGKGTELAVALDAMLLSAVEELIPDVLAVQEWGEVRLELDESTGAAGFVNVNARLLSERQELTGNNNTQSGSPPEAEDGEARPCAPSFDTSAIRPSSDAEHVSDRHTRMITSSHMRIHIEGLRIAAHNLGYYARYALNSWFGYEDEGLMSIDIGKCGKKGEGLGLDVVLEVDTDSKTSADGSLSLEDRKLFKVLSVDISLPGLELSIRHSKHWIFNSLFLAPFAGPIGRIVGSRILSSQVRSGLEKLEETMRRAKDKVDDRTHTRRSESRFDGTDEEGIWDWWEVMLEVFGERRGDSDSESSEEEDAYTETHTKATLKGFVRETYTQPEPPPSGLEESPELVTDVDNPAESVVAVGLGAQLLPGKAEPLITRDSPIEVVRGVADTAQEMVTDVGEASEQVGRSIDEGIRKAVDVRREIEHAEDRMERRERVERHRSGWRSRVFDM